MKSSKRIFAKSKRQCFYIMVEYGKKLVLTTLINWEFMIPSPLPIVFEFSFYILYYKNIFIMLNKQLNETNESMISRKNK